MWWTRTQTEAAKLEVKVSYRSARWRPEGPGWWTLTVQGDMDGGAFLEERLIDLCRELPDLDVSLVALPRESPEREGAGIAVYNARRNVIEWRMQSEEQLSSRWSLQPPAQGYADDEAAVTQVSRTIPAKRRHRSQSRRIAQRRAKRRGAGPELTAPPRDVTAGSVQLKMPVGGVTPTAPMAEEATSASASSAPAAAAAAASASAPWTLMLAPMLAQRVRPLVA